MLCCCCRPPPPPPPPSLKTNKNLRWCLCVFRTWLLTCAATSSSSFERAIVAQFNVLYCRGGGIAASGGVASLQQTTTANLLLRAPRTTPKGQEDEKFRSTDPFPWTNKWTTRKEWNFFLLFFWYYKAVDDWPPPDGAPRASYRFTAKQLYLVCYLVDWRQRL